MCVCVEGGSFCNLSCSLWMLILALSDEPPVDREFQGLKLKSFTVCFYSVHLFFTVLIDPIIYMYLYIYTYIFIYIYVSIYINIYIMFNLIKNKLLRIQKKCIVYLKNISFSLYTFHPFFFIFPANQMVPNRQFWDDGGRSSSIVPRHEWGLKGSNGEQAVTRGWEVGEKQEMEGGLATQ